MPADATRQDAKTYRKEWATEVSELDADHDPSDDEKGAVNLAFRLWVDSTRYDGYPHGGGYKDQPMNWKRAMDVVYAAREAAERDLRFDDAEDKAQKGNR